MSNNSGELLAELVRNGVVESIHTGHLVEIGADVKRDYGGKEIEDHIPLAGIVAGLFVKLCGQERLFLKLGRLFGEVGLSLEQGFFLIGSQRLHVADRGKDLRFGDFLGKANMPSA